MEGNSERRSECSIESESDFMSVSCCIEFERAKTKSQGNMEQRSLIGGVNHSVKPIYDGQTFIFIPYEEIELKKNQATALNVISLVKTHSPNILRIILI